MATKKKAPAKAQRAPKDDFPTTRFLQLVDRLAAEVGRQRGWQTIVARKLGIHRSTLLRLLAGERGVTASMIERAHAAIPELPAGWFADPTLGGLAMRPDTSDGHEAWVRVAVAGAELRFAPADSARDLLAATLEALDRVPIFPAYRAARAAIERGRDVDIAASNLAGALGISLSELAGDGGLSVFRAYMNTAAKASGGAPRQ